MVRQEGKTPTTKLWLFCEGLTEHHYFSQLKTIEYISRLHIEIHTSHNTDAIGIINYARGYKESHTRDFRDDDYIYCIFDRDQNTNQQLEQAKAQARTNNFKIIFSNPAFEYWLLCHYKYHSTQLENVELVRMLNNDMPGGYTKQDKALYKKTSPLKATTIKNAKRIHKTHTLARKEIISKESNPVTSIFELVEFLEQFKEA
jgi:hypothetical protein